MILNKHNLLNKINELNHYVYALLDSSSNLPFYIGKGFGNRIFDHEIDSLRNNPICKNKHLVNKIRLLVKNNVGIKYLILFSTINENEAFEREIVEINKIGLKNLTNIHPGGRGRPVGKIEHTYGLEKSITFKHKISDNHADVSGCKNPRYKALPDTIKLINLNGKSYYEFACTNPKDNKNCKITLKYIANKKGKSRAMCNVGKQICLSCATYGENNAMYGHINPMTGRSIKDIWINKYGIDIANKMWANTISKSSNTRLGVKRGHYKKQLS